jgi:hypothetical protein
MGSTKTFTRDFHNDFIDGSLMIWFPVWSYSHSTIVLSFLCYCFLSLSRSRHEYEFSFIVDFIQIEFDRVIETIITKNSTFSLVPFCLFPFDKSYGFTYGCLFYLCIGKRTIRINNCIQSRSYYIPLASHMNMKMQ